jgi:two-component system cell cycle sensor histidine kinase/response regulator CckA
MRLDVAPESIVLGMTFAKNSYPMWIFDQETLAFLDVNDTAVKRYGFSRQEFLTMTLRDIRPSEDLPDLLRRTQNLGAGTQATAERWRHVDKYGVVFPVAITSWRLIFNGRPAELVIARRDDVV